MNYRVLVVDASGTTHCLFRGRAVDTQFGTIYSSPSAAYRALESYERKPRQPEGWKVKPLLFVIDKEGNYV